LWRPFGLPDFQCLERIFGNHPSLVREVDKLANRDRVVVDSLGLGRLTSFAAGGPLGTKMVDDRDVDL